MALDQLSWWKGGGGVSNIKPDTSLVLLVFLNRGYIQTFLFFFQPLRYSLIPMQSMLSSNIEFIDPPIVETFHIFPIDLS